MFPACPPSPNSAHYYSSVRLCFPIVEPVCPVLRDESVAPSPQISPFFIPKLATCHSSLACPELRGATVFLTPIIPAHTRSLHLSPIIPAHTQKQWGGGLPPPQNCSPNVKNKNKNPSVASSFAAINTSAKPKTPRTLSFSLSRAERSEGTGASAHFAVAQRRNRGAVSRH
jgi:hypothetical protein